MKNNVEHYVVKPNTPAYDWPYEYSTPSNNSSCNCANNSEKLSVSIDNLQSTIAQLQKSVSDVSTIDIHDEEFTTILNQAITEYLTVQENATNLKEFIDSEIQNKFGMTSTTDITTLKTQVASLKANVADLQPIVNNITNLTELSQFDVTELQQYGDNITQITADLTGLQEQLNTLKTTVNNISSNIGDTINDAVTTVLQETTALDNKVEQAVNSNSTVQSMSDHMNNSSIHMSEEDRQRWNNVSQLSDDLDNHIDDLNKHFGSNDVHVTAEDKAKWDAAAIGNGSDWDISVENKTISFFKS